MVRQNPVRRIIRVLWGSYEVWGFVTWIGIAVIGNVLSFFYAPFLSDWHQAIKVGYGVALFVVALPVSVLVIALLRSLLGGKEGNGGQVQHPSVGPSGTGGHQAQAQGSGNTQIQTSNVHHGDIYNITINVTPRDLEEMMTEQPQQPQFNVTSHGQTGGITAGIVNILGDLGPKLEATEINHAELPDGHHRYESILTIESQYSVPEVRITAYAESIVSLDVAPQRGGMHMFGHTGKREGYHFTTIQNASGKYRIRVITEKEEQVKMNVG